MGNTYSKGFKIRAVRLSRQDDVTCKEVAEDLGMFVTSLHRWRKQFRDDGGGAFPGRGRYHPAGRAPSRVNVLGRGRLPSVLTDPVLAPDIRTDYVCLARLCDAVSSTTGSRLVWTLWGFPSPTSQRPTACRCSPPGPTTYHHIPRPPSFQIGMAYRAISGRNHHVACRNAATSPSDCAPRNTRSIERPGTV